MDPREVPGQARQPVASFQNALEAPQILRGPRAQRNMAHLPLEPWYSRGARVAQVLVIPVAVVYCVFIHDFGPQEHVFSAPQRWFKEQMSSWKSANPAVEKLHERKS